MEATAHARYVRISPRKVDQILMLVRGKSVAHALATLRLVTKGARPLVEKTLMSAMANTGNHRMQPGGISPGLGWVPGPS
jgi:large subunit ribosomal protein L22